MKKIILIALVSGCSLVASAQSLDLGLRGGVASTWLMNSNVFNAGSDQDVVMSWSPTFGFHSEFNFLGGTGIEFEVLSSSYTQKYKGTFEDIGGLYQNESNLSLTSLPNVIYDKNESYTSSTKISMLKLPLLFHYEAKGGFSIEVGPEYCSISDVTYSATYSGEPVGQPSSVSYSSKSSFGSSSLNAVLGFGWNVKLIPSGKLYLLTDLRFEYGLSDIKGTDALGEDMNNTSTNPVYQPHSFRGYGSYTSTHMLEGSFSVGLFYRINFLTAAKGFM
ncbi:MAG TPA: outer membrane beta-barrel protein [Bacteroidia bacterium]|jgi:hypothetical protein|nr:outer membrane beta-barrel protein [Bacteroidia bacterium]